MSLPAVIFGGPSPEHDVSVSTGLQAVRTLGEVLPLYWSLVGTWHLVKPDLEVTDFAGGIPAGSRQLRVVVGEDGGFYDKRKPLPVSAAVLATHGGPGEDGTLQALLDLMGIRYSGPNSFYSGLGMDKFSFAAVARQAGLALLDRDLLTSTPPDFPPPFIVKPRFGGSSIGIAVVSDHATALDLTRNSPHLERGGVIEPWVEGVRDLQISVRTFPQWESSAIEAPPAQTEFLGYQDKYLAWADGGGAGDHIISLPEQFDREVREIARQVTQLFGLRSVARIDFLERDGQMWLNEVNTIPGSHAAYLWPEVPQTQLLADVLAETLAQPPPQFVVAGADGAALRSAGSIAAKLG